MNLEHATAKTLKVGVLAGLALIMIGLCLMYTDNGDGVLYSGILLLILSPFLGSIVSLVCLISQKDWYWAIVAVILVVITSAGLLVNVI